jgi:hypothetical protein
MNSLPALTFGTSNVAIGKNTMVAADGGESDNVAIGVDVMVSVNNPLSDGNIAIGQDSLTGGTGGISDNVAIGRNALNSTGANNVTGSVAIGKNALTANTGNNAYGNTAIGYNALATVTSGLYNTAVGWEAAKALQSDRFGCTAVGFRALHQNAPAASTDGSTAIGNEAGGNQTSG